MARIPMITRTIITTKATVLCLNTETAEPFNQTVTVPRKPASDKELLAVCKAIIDTDTVSAVKVVHTEVCETLYGMTEQKFVEMAEVMPTKKVEAND